MSQEMDLTGKWPYPNILEYHTIQGQHEIHYHKTMAPTTIANETSCFYVLYVLWTTALCHEGEQHNR